MKAKIDTLIVEPSDIVRVGLQNILSNDGCYNFLAHSSDTLSIEERIQTLQPDLLIINPTLLTTPARLQIATIQQIKPSMAIVALVYQYVDPMVMQLFKSQIDIREKQNRISSILKNEVHRIESPSDDSDYELSDRELEVLILVAQGLSSKEIANKLNISVHTVNSHRKNITHKTGIKSVAGLAVYAMLHNLA